MEVREKPLQEEDQSQLLTRDDLFRMLEEADVDRRSLRRQLEALRRDLANERKRRRAVRA